MATACSSSKRRVAAVSVAQGPLCLRVTGMRLAPLAHGFKEENGSSLRDIQRINLAGHGDTDGKLAVPDWTHPSVLSAHDQCTGEMQINLGIALTG